jgi:hypothetical protein
MHFTSLPVSWDGESLILSNHSFSFMRFYLFVLYVGVFIQQFVQNKKMDVSAWLFDNGLFVLSGSQLYYKTNRLSCDIQGRYLLPGLFAFVLFAWKGMANLLRKKDLLIAECLFSFSIWQYFFIICYVLIPRYYV